MVWGGIHLNKCKGVYDHKHAQIKIPQKKLQAFLDGLCDFSNDKRPTLNEAIFEKRRAIISHLYNAAIACHSLPRPLPSLRFIEKEKRKKIEKICPFEEATPHVECSDGWIIFTYRDVLLRDLTDFYDTKGGSRGVWGGIRLDKCHGVYNPALSQIKIPEKNL